MQLRRAEQKAGNVSFSLFFKMAPMGGAADFSEKPESMQSSSKACGVGSYRGAIEWATESVGEERGE